MIRSVLAGRPFKIQNTTLTFSGCFPLVYDTSLSKKIDVGVQHLLSRCCLPSTLESSLEIEVEV